jgi:hypothetical protein
MPHKYDDATVGALAESWSSMIGELETFLSERQNVSPQNPESPTGTYEGYMADAEELLKRLEERGYRLVKKRSGLSLPSGTESQPVIGIVAGSSV